MLAQAQFTITDLRDPVISGSEPAAPIDDMLWLDTSSEPSILKRYNSETGEWEALNDMSSLENSDTELQQRMSAAEQKITDTAITNTVMSQKKFIDYSNGVNTKIESVSSQQTQTESSLRLEFNQQISTTRNDLNQVKDNLTWFSFSEDGLEIGKNGSKFKTKQNNERYSFLENGVEVAYLEGSKMAFPRASVETELILGQLKGIVSKNGDVFWELIETT